MADKQQKLVLSILDFLQASVADGTVKQDDVESLEVASASRSAL
jgi:small glutamine-rich tetratricopeptide repeat-containing protein alpha